MRDTFPRGEIWSGLRRQKTPLSQSVKEILTTEEYSNLIGQEHLRHARLRMLKINSVCLFLSFMSIYIQKIKVTCHSPQEISVIEEYLNLIDQGHF